MSKLLTNLLKATGIVALVYYIYLMAKSLSIFDTTKKFIENAAEELDS